MSTSLFTKIAIAAAATMVTLSPALADRGHRGHDHRYESHGYGHNHFKKHKHFKKYRYYSTKRYWGKPRFRPGYGYNPYHRRWY